MIKTTDQFALPADVLDDLLAKLFFVPGSELDFPEDLPTTALPS